MPSTGNSTGSSAVRILVSIVFNMRKQAYRVVVFPEPVGPVTRNTPFGCTTQWRILSSTFSGMDKASRLIKSSLEESKRRNTTDSPNLVGKVLIRKTNSRPAIRSAIRPSCGIRRSAIFKPAMIFKRDEIAGANSLGGGVSIFIEPSTFMRI